LKCSESNPLKKRGTLKDFLIMALGLDGGPTIAAAAIASFLPRSRASN
jgi:hypothetical protein